MAIKKVNKYYIIGIIVTVILIFQVLPVKQVATNPFIATDRPLIIGHGGTKLMMPENTMLAYDYAVENEADVLEGDIQLTKDNQLVMFHDDTINNLSDGTGLIKDYTYDELLKFNFGAKFKDPKGNMPYQNKHVDLLKTEDLIKKYPDKLFIFEIKDNGAQGELVAQKLYELVKKYQLQDQVCIASFDKNTIKKFREISHNEFITSSSYNEVFNYVINTYSGTDAFYTPVSSGFQIPPSEGVSGVKIDLSNRFFLARAHRHNMFVHYWTINDEKTMQQLLSLNVDGIITDDPALLNKIMKEKGLK